MEPGLRRTLYRPAVGEIATWAMVRLRATTAQGLQFAPRGWYRKDASTGESLWVADCDVDCQVGLAFPWSFIAPGVVVVSNSLEVTTNALFFDDSGVMLAPSLQAIWCVALLHSVPWQAELTRELT